MKNGQVGSFRRSVCWGRREVPGEVVCPGEGELRFLPAPPAEPCYQDRPKEAFQAELSFMFLVHLNDCGKKYSGSEFLQRSCDRHRLSEREASRPGDLAGPQPPGGRGRGVTGRVRVSAFKSLQRCLLASVCGRRGLRVPSVSPFSGSFLTEEICGS